jgi:hypothetical protein
MEAPTKVRFPPASGSVITDEITNVRVKQMATPVAGPVEA